jgi:hypothetical protein
VGVERENFASVRHRNSGACASCLRKSFERLICHDVADTSLVNIVYIATPRFAHAFGVRNSLRGDEIFIQKISMT